jgi:hypothetical protein
MARRIQLTLATAAAAGQTASQDWPGGEGVLFVGGTFGSGASVALQERAPDGNYYTLQNYATATPISVTVAGTANFRAPAGPLSLLIVGATASVNAWAVGVPSNAAG